MNPVTHHTPYSYRSDPNVPDFQDDGPILFMDGECALCTRGARIISTLDRRQEFRICPTQSTLGRSILVHYDFDPADPDTWLYMDQGQVYGSLDAMIRVGNRLGDIGRLMNVFAIFPTAIQDWLYRRLARNRYWLFGRTQMCSVPDQRLRARLME